MIFSWQNDVVGARLFGFQALWRNDSEEAEGSIGRIRNLQELAELLSD